MGSSIKVAGIQIMSASERDKTLKKASTLIEIASSEGASIVALPALFGTRFFPATIDKGNFSLAEDSGGETISFVREEARRHRLSIVANIFEKDGDRFFNTAFIIGQSGDIAGKYRKVHVPQIPLWEERAYFSKGDLGFPVFDVSGIKVGVLLCWDVFFPEAFRVLRLKGAELVIAPTASAFRHSSKKWERAIQAAAHTSGVYVLRVNRVGEEERQEFYGMSFCVGPDGEFVQPPAGSGEGVIVASIDADEIKRTRREWVFFDDRAPSEYQDIGMAVKREGKAD
jgi:N-carbamoylputrescine amidase